MSFVKIVEVGPRDGLQNEPRTIPTTKKVKLTDLLSEVGFQEIETASFVSPKWVPQMDDGAAVMACIQRRPGTIYSALTPNLKGYEAAKAAQTDQVAIFAAATESFSQKNINASIEDSLKRFEQVAAAARSDHMPLRGYISCVVHCPYEGAVSPNAVAKVTSALFELGCREVSLGDTTGQGTPEAVDAMLTAVLKCADVAQLAGHFHDTNGRALESIKVSLTKGIQVFDTAISGLGGCPYAPGAKGNLSTGKLARWLKAAGFETGLDFDRLETAEAFADQFKGSSHDL